MTVVVHRSLAAGRWHDLALTEQLGNIGSEVGRALRAKNTGNMARADAAFDRCLELFDLTLADDRWHGRRREIARARQVIAEQCFADNSSEDASIDRYFLQFAAARRPRPANPSEAPTSAGALLELDVARVRRFCRGRIPEHLREQIRLDVQVTGRHITMIERRAPWTPEIGPEWTSMRIAQLRQRATDGTWTLFWSDRNNVWHRDLIEPTPDVDQLIARITEDPANRYWG